MSAYYAYYTKALNAFILQPYVSGTNHILMIAFMYLYLIFMLFAFIAIYYTKKNGRSIQMLIGTAKASSLIMHYIFIMPFTLVNLNSFGCVDKGFMDAYSTTQLSNANLLNT